MQAISMTKPMVSQSSSVGTTEIMVTPLPANRLVVALHP